MRSGEAIQPLCGIENGNGASDSLSLSCSEFVDSDELQTFHLYLKEMSTGKGLALDSILLESTSIADFYIKNSSSIARISARGVGDSLKSSSTKIPTSLQKELALLWRTLSIMRFSGLPSMMSLFFQELHDKVRVLSPLSLSAYWQICKEGEDADDDASKLCRNSPTNNSVMDNLTNTSSSNQNRMVENHVGIPQTQTFDNRADDNETDAFPLSSTELRSNRDDGIKSPSFTETKGEKGIMDLPELNYLDETSGGGDPSQLDGKHDPLGVVQKLLDAAESCALTVRPADRGELLSVCLALAVKSGRTSLLCQVATLLLLNEGAEIHDIDAAVMLEIQAHVRHLKKGRKKKRILKDKESRPSSVLFQSSAGTTQDTKSQHHEGTLLSFGKSDHGKLGHGDTQLHRLVPTVIQALQGIRITKTASMSTCALAVDVHGAVYVWGSGCAPGGTSSKSDVRPLRLDALPIRAIVRDISCGLGHALFLADESKGGCVYSWGNGGNGRLGLGDMVDRTTACVVPGLVSVDVRSVQCGASHSMALCADGGVLCWGKNSQGQCGLGHTDDNILSPALNRSLESMGVLVTQIAAGWEHSVALSSEGSVYTWGCGYKDSRRGVVPPVLGLGHNEGRSVPQLVPSFGKEAGRAHVVKVSCGWDHCLALTGQGFVYSWGSGQNGKLGLGSEENMAVPTVVEALSQLRVVRMSAGCEHSACITADGRLFSWGHGDGGRLGHGDNLQTLLPQVVQPIELMGTVAYDVHCGDKFTMVLVNSKADITNDIEDKESDGVVESKDENDTVVQYSYRSVHSRVDSTLSRCETDASAGKGLEKGEEEKQSFKEKCPSNGAGTGLLSRREAGSALLSLLSRSCELDAGSPRSWQRDRAYGVEVCPSTFGCLLTLLEQSVEGFTASLEQRGFAEPPQVREIIESVDEQPNLDESINMDNMDMEESQDGSVSGMPHSPQHGLERKDLSITDCAGLLEANFGPLLCALDLVQANLKSMRAITVSAASGILGTKKNPESGEETAEDISKRPRFLNQLDECGGSDIESESSHGSRSEEGSDFEQDLAGDVTAAGGDLGMQDIATLVEFLKLQHEGEAEGERGRERSGLVEGGRQANDDEEQQTNASAYRSSSNSPVPTCAVQTDSSAEAGGGDSRSAAAGASSVGYVGSGDSRPLSQASDAPEPQCGLGLGDALDLNLDASAMTMELSHAILPSGDACTGRGENNAILAAGGAEAVESAPRSRTPEEDPLESSLALSVQSGVDVGAASFMDAAEAQLGESLATQMLPTMMPDMPEANTDIDATAPYADDSLLNTKELSLEGSQLGSSVEGDGCSLQSGGSSDLYDDDDYSEDSNGYGYAHTEDDLMDADMQSAILSSMEMPGGGEEGRMVRRRFLHTVEEVENTLPRLLSLCYNLASCAFTFLSEPVGVAAGEDLGSETSSFRRKHGSTATHAWIEAQAPIAAAFDSILTASERRGLVCAVVKRPQEELWRMPAVISGLLQCNDSNSDFGGALLVSIVTSAVEQDVAVANEGIYKSPNTLLTSASQESFLSAATDKMDISPVLERLGAADINSFLQFVRKELLEVSEAQAKAQEVDNLTLPAEALDLLRTSGIRLSRALLVVLARSYLLEEKDAGTGPEELGLVLATAVECVTADLRRSKKMLESGFDVLVESTFAGQILPLLCTLFSTDNPRSVCVFSAPAWSLLQQIVPLGVPMSHSKVSESARKSWKSFLGVQTRWLLLYSASLAHALLSPPARLVPNTVRRAYAPLWAVFDCEAAIGSDSDGNVFRWDSESAVQKQRQDMLRLTRAVRATLDEPAATGAKNSDAGRQWMVTDSVGSNSEKTPFPDFTDSFSALDVGTTAGLRKMCDWLFEYEVWTEFFVRCAYIGKADKLISALLTSIAPIDSVAVAETSLGDPPSSDTQMAVYLRRLLFALLLHAHGKRSADDAAMKEVTCARLWTQALLLTMTVLTLLPGGVGEPHVRKTMLSHVCCRAQDLLSLPLRPFYCEDDLCLSQDMASASKEQFFQKALYTRTLTQRLLLGHTPSRSRVAAPLRAPVCHSAACLDLLEGAVSGVSGNPNGENKLLSGAPPCAKLLLLLAEKTPIQDLRVGGLWAEVVVQNATFALKMMCKVLQVFHDDHLAQRWLCNSLQQISRRNRSALRDSAAADYTGGMSRVQRALDVLDQEMSVQIKAISLPVSAVSSQPVEDAHGILSTLPALLGCLRSLHQLALVCVCGPSVDCDAVLEQPMAAYAQASAKVVKLLSVVGAQELTNTSGGQPCEVTSTALASLLCSCTDQALYRSLSPEVPDGLSSSGSRASRVEVLPLRRLAMCYSSVLPVVSKSLVGLSAQASSTYLRLQKLTYAMTAAGASFLLPGRKMVDESSPGIISNVFTPNGDFTVGFWLRLPPHDEILQNDNNNNDALGAEEKKQGERTVHILSRVPETGDFNLVSLLSGAKDVCPCSPHVTVRLDAEGGVILETAVSVQEVSYVRKAEHSSSDVHTHTRTLHLGYRIPRSSLTAEGWVHCAISSHAAIPTASASGKEKGSHSLSQSDENKYEDKDSFPAPPSPSSSSPSADASKEADNVNIANRAHTTISLFVAGTLVAKDTVSGSYSAPHQNMVLGSIPASMVGRFKKQGLQLAGVYWVPGSAPSGLAGESEGVSPLCGGFALDVPPCALVARVEQVLDASCTILRALTQCVASAATHPSSIPNNVLVALPVMLNFALELVYVGREEAQRVALEAVAAVIAFLPSPGHAQEMLNSEADLGVEMAQGNSNHASFSLEDSLMLSPPAKIAQTALTTSTPDRDRDSAVTSANGTPVPVGSAVNATHARKATSALERVLRELGGILNSLLVPATVESAFTSTVSSVAGPYAREIWLMRSAHSHASSGSGAAYVSSNGSYYSLAGQNAKRDVSGQRVGERGVEPSLSLHALSSKALVGGVVAVLCSAVHKRIVDMSVFEGLPMSQSPRSIQTKQEYSAHVSALVCAGGLPLPLTLDCSVSLPPSPLFYSLAPAAIAHRPGTAGAAASLQALRRSTVFPCVATVADIGPRFGLRLQGQDSSFRLLLFGGVEGTGIDTFSGEEGISNSESLILGSDDWTKAVQSLPQTNRTSLVPPSDTLSVCHTHDPVSLDDAGRSLGSRRLPDLKELLTKLRGQFAPISSSCARSNKESGRKSQRSSPNRTYNSAGGSLSLISPDTADEDHPPLALVDTPGSADRAGLDRDLPSPLGHGLSLANPGAGLVIEDDLAMEDLSLFATMVHLRCLLVQLSSGVRLEDLVEVLQQSLPSIASIAGGNISDTAGGVISSVGAKCARSAAGAFGLLKSVLEECDSAFLERVSLDLFDKPGAGGVALDFSYSNAGAAQEPVPQSPARGAVYSGGGGGRYLAMVALLGDVQVVDNKIRALSHFPSLKLPGVPGLQPMSGRWFYECCLLSDGLMQIGWADEHFRSDPVCGQGVGDHLHSWAFDGLRTKKWNVSCDSYGKRWRLGDVVGVLLDLDLLEMRFYLNGEDLGPAFSDFSSAGKLYPALSLNVRQSVRVNFGQYRFAFPPDKVDGLPYRPVCESTSHQVVSAEKEREKVSRLRDSAKEGLSASPARIPRNGRAQPEAQTPHRVTPLQLRTDTAQGDAEGEGGARRPAGARSTTPRPGSSSRNAAGGARVVEGGSDSANTDGDAAAPSEGRPIQAADSALEGENNNSTGAVEQDVSEGEGDMEEEEGEDDDERDSEYQAEAEEEEQKMREEDILQQRGWRQLLDSEHDGHRLQEDSADAEDAMNREEPMHLGELRRQVLIENLIGMGFPIDWALRGAENCDATTSESTVIAWIIERMELEQARMEYEHENEDVDVDGEEDGEGEGQGGLEDGESGLEQRPMSGDDDVDVDGDLGIGASEDMSLEYLLHRHTYVRAGLAGAAENMGEGMEGLRAYALAHSSDAEAANLLVGAREGPMEATKGLSDLLGPAPERLRGYDDGSWRGEVTYAPVLLSAVSLAPAVGSDRRYRPGTYQLEKEELVLLLDELELPTARAVVATSQFALCVLYARALLAKALGLLSSGKGLKAESNNKSHSQDTSPTKLRVREKDGSPLPLLANLTLNKNPSSLHGFVFDALLNRTSAADLLGALQQCVLSSVARSAYPPPPGHSLPYFSFSTRPELILPSHRLVAPHARPSHGEALQACLLRLQDAFEKEPAKALPRGDVGPALVEEGSGGSTVARAWAFLGTLVARAEGGTGISEEGTEEGTNTEVCCALLSSAVQSAIECFELVSGLESSESDVDGSSLSSWDWLLNRPEAFEGREEKDDGCCGLDYSCRPPVLWSFFLLSAVLANCSRYNADSKAKESEPLSKWRSGSPCEYAASGAAFSRLLSVSASPNVSLRFLVLQLCTAILRLAPPAQAASYVLPAEQERLLLLSFGQRFREERQQRRAASEYSRVLADFLLVWQELRHIHASEEEGTDGLLRRQALGDATAALALDMDAAAGGVWVDDSSPSNLLIRWELPLGLGPVSGELLATAVGRDGPDLPVRVCGLESAAGSHRIVRLFPDTLYRVEILIFPESGPAEDKDKDDDKAEEKVAGNKVYGNEELISGPGQGSTAVSIPVTVSTEDSKEDKKVEIVEVVNSETGNDIPKEIASRTVDGAELKESNTDASEEQAQYNKSDKNDEPEKSVEEEDPANPNPNPTSSPLDLTADKETEEAKDIVPLIAQSWELLTSTEPEPLFLIDAATSSANLELSKAHLSLRNVGNKKWSTARAATKMVSGVHKWDVRVDRCISKNIFLGVVAADARVDNYVGCDKHGWAFLANKAIWHNKSKIGSYGELFRTGDQVTVILDLDIGTLSFALNGKDMGVAVDGLSGPLYPAFSLYNEDDQVSIRPHRQAIHNPLVSLDPEMAKSKRDGFGPTSELAVGTRTADRVLDALAAFRSVCNVLLMSGSAPQEEAELRLQLWLVGIKVRSAAYTDGILSIIVCDKACAALLDGPKSEAETLLVLRPSSKVALDGQEAVLVGAALGKLWFQSTATGELSGYGRETVFAMLAAETLIVRSAGRSGRPEAVPADVRERIKSGQGSEESWAPSDDALLREWVEVVASRDGVSPVNLSAQSVLLAREAFSSFNTPKWARVSVPCSLGRFAALLLAKSSCGVLRRVNLLLHFNDLLLPLLPLVGPCGTEGGPFDRVLDSSSSSPTVNTTSDANNSLAVSLLRLRALVFDFAKSGHLRQMACPIDKAGSGLPILDASDSVDSAVSVATASLAGVCASVTAYSVDPCFADASQFDALDFGDNMGASPTGLTGSSSPPKTSLPKALQKSSTPSTKMGGDVGLGAQALELEKLGKDSSNSNSKSPLKAALVELFVDSPEQAATRLLSSARELNQEHLLLRDAGWSLVARMQCSLVGQFSRGLQRLSGQSQDELSAILGGSWSAIGNSNSSSNSCADSKWESVYLRRFCSDSAFTKSTAGAIAYDGLGLERERDMGFSKGSKGPVFPFALRQRGAQGVGAAEKENSRFMRLLALNERAEALGLLKGVSRVSISQTALFSAFAEEALQHAGTFFDDLPLYAEAEPFVGKAMGLRELGIALQFSYAVGVLYGLTVRAGMAVPLFLPESTLMAVSEQLSGSGTSRAGNSKAQADLVAEQRHAVCLSICRGITAVVPESVLLLQTPQDVLWFFQGAPRFGSASFWRRRARCESSDVSPTDLHVLLFFEALGLINGATELLVQHLFFEPLKSKSAESRPREEKAVRELAAYSCLVPFEISPLGLATDKDKSDKSMSAEKGASGCPNSNGSPSILVLPPTALAMLGADNAPLLTFPEKGAISIPRYSSLDVAKARVLELMRELKGSV